MQRDDSHSAHVHVLLLLETLQQSCNHFLVESHNTSFQTGGHLSSCSISCCRTTGRATCGLLHALRALVVPLVPCNSDAAIKTKILIRMDS